MKKRFKRVYIEITNICNLDCSFCPKNSRKPERMDLARFEKIIAEVKPYTDHIYLHIMGEPLLHPLLPQFLKVAEENNLFINITTNGTLLKNHEEELLKSKALRQVNISLHSFEANENHLSLKEYLSIITDFCVKAQAEGRLNVSIRLWNLDSAEHKGKNDCNDEILAILAQNLKLSVPSHQELEEKKRVKIAERLYLNAAEKFAWPDLSLETERKEGFCLGLRSQLGILVDGTVVPCCLDSEGSITLGNILKTPLTEILSDTRAAEFFDGFSKRIAVEPLCQRCGYAKRF